MAMRPVLLLCLSLFAARPLLAQSEPALDDYVLLRDSSRVEGRIQVEKRPRQGLVFVVDGAQEYGHGDVQAFVRGGIRYVIYQDVDRYRDRYSIEPRLLARVQEGRLDLYREHAPGEPLRLGGSYTHFKQAGRPIREIRYRYLNEALRGHPASRRALRAARRWHVVRLGTLVAGAVATGYGVYRTVQENPLGETRSVNLGTVFELNLSPWIPAGLGITLFNVVPHRLERARLRAAIQHYNQ